VGIAPLRIVKPGEEPLVARALRLKPDAVLARNLATLDLFAKEAPEIPCVADLTLNVVNELSAAWLVGKKVCRWTPGQDLNWAQFEALLRHVAPAEIEFVAHICMPMFHTEHCLYAANLSQGKSHLDCGRPCEAHRIVLNDPAGMRFPVLVDAGCRNTVYNSRAQSASEHLARLVELGVRWFRVELLEETGPEALALVEGYSRVLAGKETGGELWRRLRLDHRLGLTRGTLNLA
jgi:putative protease